MLPKWYKKWIPRVSSVVEFVFPFEGYAKENYLRWLQRNNISEKDYIKEACDVWTYIHQKMETYMLGLDKEESDVIEAHKSEVYWWRKYIKKLKKKFPWIKWVTEEVVIDKYWRFQGTIDLVRINEDTKEVWLYDYKSYEVARKRWGLPIKLRKDGTPPRPTNKLKKVSLQLSLYAETYKQKGYKVKWIYAVWLHSTGCYEYKLEPYSIKELSYILSIYGVENIKIPKDVLLFINYIDMRIEVQTGIEWKPYSKAGVTLEREDLWNWKTVEENIKLLVSYQKKLLKEYGSK